MPVMGFQISQEGDPKWPRWLLKSHMIMYFHSVNVHFWMDAIDRGIVMDVKISNWLKIESTKNNLPAHGKRSAE